MSLNSLQIYDAASFSPSNPVILASSFAESFSIVLYILSSEISFEKSLNFMLVISLKLEDLSLTLLQPTSDVITIKEQHIHIIFLVPFKINPSPKLLVSITFVLILK